MKKHLFRLPFAVAFGLTFGPTVTAEKSPTVEKAVKIAVIVVGRTVKMTGTTLKIVAPAMLNATERSAILSAKSTGVVIKKLAPPARKLLVTYLKAKLPL